MGWCEDCEIVELLMDIGSRSLGLDAALEASIVPVVGHILDLQIVNASLRLKVESGKEKGNQISQELRIYHHIKYSP